MPASRSELDAALYQLHAALPLWRNVVPSDALFDQYGEKLADLVSDAAPGDLHYAIAQASHLMAAVDMAAVDRAAVDRAAVDARRAI